MAEQQVGCEGEDGLLRIHPESETCDVCRDVPVVFHLRQYGDVSKEELDYYMQHGTLDGFKRGVLA